ncbi:MAG: ParB/RepB/Spo0J family partition protein [Tannerella sp.]|jgi:ParB family chromosome partitioning protein|nr:ParB/RepB/Spo0J family partition protein [Tannerella sp.]
MRAKANKSTNSVQEVKLSEIVVNSYNPRKFIDEMEIQELAESVKEFGVLQPVLLRKVEDRFEIVYGERRFRASEIAGLQTIPANIREFTDEQALEICITENLQRSDIKPIEECRGFLTLLETKKYDYSAIAKKVGKSEGYIRNRVKLNDLIGQIAAMIDSDEINIGIGLCLATYPVDIQHDVYKNHLQMRNYTWWGNLSLKNFTSMMENTYTLLLENYQFDKNNCIGCPHNTNSYSLFPVANEGKCNKRECLLQKNTQFLVYKMIEIAAEQNIQFVTVDASNNMNNTVYDSIEQEGLFLVDDTVVSYPVSPQEPKEEDFEHTGNHAEAMEDYAREMSYCEDDKAEFEDGITKGKYEKCVLIRRNRVTVEYIVREFDHETGDSQDDDEGGEAEGVSRPKTKKIVDDEIARIKAKDTRNQEIRIENILDDAKTLINGLPSYSGEMSELETKMMYCFMSGSVSYDKAKDLFGCDGHPTSDKKKQAVEKLTPESMTLIIREFIRANFCSAVYRGHATEEEFLQFVNQHCPAQLAEIEKKYTDVYDKRKAKTDNELLLLTQETEASETQTDGEEPESTSKETVLFEASEAASEETREDEIMTGSETSEDHTEYTSGIGTDEEAPMMEVA